MGAGLEPLRSTDWDAAKARHLLNRAAFGIPRDRVDEWADLGLDRAVDEVVGYQNFDFPSIKPAFVVEANAYRELNKQWRDLPVDERQKKQSEFRRQERQNIDTLAGWWMQRSAHSPRPLEEKLALLWHGHYAVSAQKVQSSGAMYQYYEVLRSHASGNLKRMTIAVGQTPAMLRYLDNARSTKEHPNENWARELMELFTMGVGNYTEGDIKESARAFTGWSTNGEDFVYRENIHDWGQKTFMGRTGPFDGWDIIDIIFEQPATAEHFARKLWTYFAYDEPEPAVVTALANGLRAHGYEVAPALREMFMSQAFYTERAMGTQIKNPVQLVVELAHDLHLDEPPYIQMAKSAGYLGQRIFYPPNVKGWDGNRAWINANTLLQRYNLPMALVNAKPEPSLDTMTSGVEAMMAGGDDMMSAPTMQPAMAEKPQEVRKPLEEALSKLSPEDRKAWQQRIRGAKDKKERREVIARLLRESGITWSPRELFAALEFDTAGECVDALAERFLAVPLEPEQKGVLLEAFGAQRPDAPLTADKLSIAAMNAALHLLFSTAEYQVC